MSKPLHVRFTKGQAGASDLPLVNGTGAGKPEDGMLQHWCWDDQIACAAWDLDLSCAPERL